MAAFQAQGTPRVVLGTERIGNGITALVAYVELNKSLLVGVSGSEGGSCCSGIEKSTRSVSTSCSVAYTVPGCTYSPTSTRGMPMMPANTSNAVYKAMRILRRPL